MFEDEGNEDGDFERTVYKGTSRVSLVSKFFDTSSYTPVIAYVFTINYLLGVGCLGIPRAFESSGLGLGVLIVIATSFVSYVTVLFIAHAAYRVMQTRELQQGNAFRDPMHIGSVETSLKSLSTSQRDEEKRPGGDYGSITPFVSSSTEYPEVIEIVSELLSPSWVLVYQFSLLLLTTTGLLAYTQVFVAAFTLQMWPNAPILYPTMIFAAMVVPLSCLDLSEQITTQVVMSAFRFISIALMLLGMIVKAIPTDSEHYKNSTSEVSSNLVHFDNAGLMFSTSLFAQLFQHSVPGLIRPLEERKRRYVPEIFQFSIMTTGGIYVLLGSLAMVSLGSSIEQSINLNFAGYLWGLDDNRERFLLRFFAKSVSLLIVLFPAFDTVSVFPLIANTLGNNLQAFVKSFVPTSKDLRRRREGEDDDKWWNRTILWRLVASIPPILLSVVLRDLTTTMQLAGACGVVVALLVPGMLQVKANERARLLPPLYHDSPYSTYVVRLEWLPWFILSFSGIAFFVVFIQFVDS